MSSLQASFDCSRFPLSNVRRSDLVDTRRASQSEASTAYSEARNRLCARVFSGSFEAAWQIAIWAV
jgi:hypothetical protein